MVVSVAPADITHDMTGSVLAVKGAEEGVAWRHSGLITPMTTDSAAPHNGIIVSPTARLQLERGFCCGRPARARDPELHPEPASPEACSTTELYSAGGQVGGEWRVPCDELGQSISTLSTDRTVATNTQHAKDESLGGVLRAATEPWRAAVSEGERAIAPSTLTLASKDKGDGPHHTSSTVSDRLMDPR